MLAVVTAGAMVGVVPRVAGATVSDPPTSVVESAPAHAIAQVREQFLRHGPGVEVLVITASSRGSATLADAQEFLNSDLEIHYLHKINDDNVDEIGAFTGRAPQAYEIGFDRLTDPQVQPAALAAVQSHARVWMNTLWYGQAAGYTDESSLRDPARGWGAVVDRHQADMIQTDNPEQLVSWLAGRDREHGGQGEWPSLPKGEVRMDDAVDQNFNIDYFQFDRVKH